jgi:hypothetical protein
MTDEGGTRSGLPALDELGKRLASAELELEPTSRIPRMTGIALAAIVVLVGLSFTPPGRVVAGEVGDLVGIGDEPTVSSRAANELDAVVIGTGATPGDQPFELVAFLLEDPNDVPELCFDLDLAEPARPTGGVCITSTRNYELLEEEGFGPVSVFGHRSIEHADLMVRGAMTSEASDVTVTYVDRHRVRQEAPVTHGQLTSELAAQIGSEWKAGAFVAFLPEGVIESPVGRSEVVDYRQVAELMTSIEVTTRDADGDIVATTRVGDPERLATLLPMSPPSRLADDFEAREQAAKECTDKGRAGVTSAPVSPSDPIGSLEESLNPELERCIAQKLAEQTATP